MESFLNSVSAVALILIMVALGYALGKLGWLKAEHKAFFGKFLINIAVPCMCIVNIFESFDANMLKSAGSLLIVPPISIVVIALLSFLTAKLLKLGKKRLGIFVAMSAFSNTMFVGYPLCYELFGDAGVIYVLLYYISSSVLFWTIGASNIYSASDVKPGAKATLKRLASAPLITLAVALTLLMLSFEPPAFIMKLCSYFSKTVTPLSLMYVGFVIYLTGFKNIRIDRSMVCALGFRFIVSPALIVGLCAIFNIAGLARGVYTVQSAMPVMAQTVAMASLAGADDSYCAVGMTLSTLACFIVVPALMLII